MIYYETQTKQHENNAKLASDRLNRINLPYIIEYSGNFGHVLKNRDCLDLLTVLQGRA